MSVKTIDIDLAKEVFQVRGIDEHGKRLFNKQLKRAKMLSFFASIPPYLIGMEACASAHFWAGKFMSMGHNVMLMATQLVKPYVKTNKHDAADAEAICEAVTRPNMRFVPVKTPEQQAVLALHRSRQSFIKQRTAQANQIRGLLAEFGIVMPWGIQQLQLPEILEVTLPADSGHRTKSVNSQPEVTRMKKAAIASSKPHARVSPESP